MFLHKIYIRRQHVWGTLCVIGAIGCVHQPTKKREITYISMRRIVILGSWKTLSCAVWKYTISRSFLWNNTRQYLSFSIFYVFHFISFVHSFNFVSHFRKLCMVNRIIDIESIEHRRWNINEPNKCRWIWLKGVDRHRDSLSVVLQSASLLSIFIPIPFHFTVAFFFHFVREREKWYIENWDLTNAYRFVRRRSNVSFDANNYLSIHLSISCDDVRRAHECNRRQTQSWQSA